MSHTSARPREFMLRHDARRRGAYSHLLSDRFASTFASTSSPGPAAVADRRSSIPSERAKRETPSTLRFVSFRHRPRRMQMPAHETDRPSRRALRICAERVAPPVATLSGISEIRSSGQVRVDEFDVAAPLGSMPLVFGTTVDTIPRAVPCFDPRILRPRKNDPGGSSTRAPGKNVGIVWSGSSRSPLDPAPRIPLELWAPIFEIPGTTFASLQDDALHEDLNSITAGPEIVDLAPRIADHGDLALRIAELDVVVSVDSLAAQVAGAIGKPVYRLLGPSPNWRWGVDGETAHWYPCMRIVRGESRTIGPPSLLESPVGSLDRPAVGHGRGLRPPSRAPRSSRVRSRAHTRNGR